MSDYRVRISDRFLEAAILAAVEAYRHGDGQRDQLEILGLIWGYRRRTADAEIIVLDRLALSTSAERDQDSVTPNPEAIRLMAEIMERICPEQTLLGDFHSHPYKDLPEVHKNKGYEFSDGDFDALKADDELWKRSKDSPVMVVIAVCRLGRVHETGGSVVRNNIWQFDIGEFRFWLNVSVGYLDNAGQRQSTPNKYSKVWLDLNSRFFNTKSDRVTG